MGGNRLRNEMKRFLTRAVTLRWKYRSRATWVFRVTLPRTSNFSISINAEILGELTLLEEAEEARLISLQETVVRGSSMNVNWKVQSSPNLLTLFRI